MQLVMSFLGLFVCQFTFIQLELDVYEASFEL